MTNTPEELKAAHQAACRYPHTTPDMFQHAALIRIDSNEIITDENTRRTLIDTSPFCRTLQGTTIALPTYNVQLPGKAALQDRIAILGIGSNCSPEVLIKKFQKAGIGGEVYLAQATLEKHAVVHSAFIGALGYMPATVMPQDNTQSFVTVGFYTPEQAEALTTTEPNYDLVHKSGAVLTHSLENAPVLKQGALLYVSIWGAFTEDGTDPVLQSGITQISPLKAEPTIWTSDKAAEITGYGTDIIRFLENIKPGIQNLESRLNHTFKLHPQNALAATIEGKPVKSATLYEQAKNLPVPMLPRITYL
jgi:hypothetical protein